MDSGRHIPAHRSAGKNTIRVSSDLALKRDALHTLLAAKAPGTIAVSGGLDSRLLAHLAQAWNLDYTCLHFCGPHVARAETHAATTFLIALGLPWYSVATNPLVLPPISANSHDRCYHCKRSLFQTARLHCRQDRTLMDGTNSSDHLCYRPGLKALAELGVTSPFALCGITKDDIRTLALAAQLPDSDQPSSPCLLTRLPYDNPVTAAALASLDGLEDDCRNAGFNRFRVRLVDGMPRLFADPVHQGLTVPVGLEVEWTERLSGYWDRG